MVDGPPEWSDHDTAKAQERRRLDWRLAVVAAGVLVLLALLVVVVVPPRFTANRTFNNDHEELKAQNDVRTTLLQGFGALLVLTGAAIGASVAYRGVQETRRQIEQAAADNQVQFTLTRQGQITDRYTKAVEQLGHEKAPVRLGALYSLEHLAQDNPNYRQTVVDVVCAYLRMPYTPPARSTPGAGHADQKVRSGEDGIPPAQPKSGQDPAEEELQVRQTAQRILAAHLRLPEGTSSEEAIEAQGREPSSDQDFWPGISLDLTGATLVDFGFAQVSVIQAQFVGAAFQGPAQFGGVTFQGPAQFGGAAFQGPAQFGGATFQDVAWFDRATFGHLAEFGEATFQGDAGFDGATFQSGARFDRATFRGGAGFHGATFQGDAGFDGATFQSGARFDRATFRDVAGFHGATFQGDAGFGGATFRGGAVFNGATFQGATSFDEAHVLRLDDDLANAVRWWPDGWTVHPDPTDSSRGTLVSADQPRRRSARWG